MERLTEKYDINYKIKGLSIEKMNRLYNSLDDNGIDFNLLANELHKLGQLEDIEEELGIDLVTLFKALENGVYVLAFEIETGYRTKQLFIKRSLISHLDFVSKKIVFDKGKVGEEERFVDYGKTWALTKEELE